MGTSKSSAELVRKIGAMSNALGDANERAVAQAALVYKRSVLAEAERDSGGDRILGRAGRSLGGGARKGVTLNAVYDVRGKLNAVARLRAVPPGPWSWLERGTKPGVRRARRGRRFVFTAGGRRHAVRQVNHPGTAAKRTWSRGVTKAEGPAVAVFKRSVARSLVRTFGR